MIPKLHKHRLFSKCTNRTENPIEEKGYGFKVTHWVIFYYVSIPSLLQPFPMSSQKY